MTYRMDSYRFRGCRTFTNKPPCGPKRGHGTPQPRFGLEVQIDRICDKLGLDPAQWRIDNALQPGANATSIDNFITNFNAGHYGVTASFDTTSQRIVFARDPNNEDLVLRGNQQTNAQTPSFTISDTPATGAGILSALGASGINNVAQNASNAYAANDNGVANALVKTFQANVGVPALETTSPAAATAGTAITIALPNGVNNVAVGQVLTIGAQPGDIARRVTADVFSMVLVGACLGCALGFVLVRYVETLLYQVRPTGLGSMAGSATVQTARWKHRSVVTLPRLSLSCRRVCVARRVPRSQTSTCEIASRRRRRASASALRCRARS